MKRVMYSDDLRSIVEVVYWNCVVSSGSEESDVVGDSDYSMSV